MPSDKPDLNQSVEAFRTKAHDTFCTWAVDGALRALAGKEYDEPRSRRYDLDGRNAVGHCC
jgi:hypothetical protein